MTSTVVTKLPKGRERTEDFGTIVGILMYGRDWTKWLEMGINMYRNRFCWRLVRWRRDGQDY